MGKGASILPWLWGRESIVRLPRSDVKLDLEGGVRVCPVEEEGRTLSALGTVCAKSGNVRIPGFRERQVSRVFGEKVAE